MSAEEDFMAKIIIVDDDPAMVSVLSEVLREHRHEW